jgi:hypothetical protein
MNNDFDADSFMNSVVETGETRMPVTPVGEYSGTIAKIEPASGTIGVGERAGQPWFQARIAIETADPAALAGTNMTKRLVRGSIMLDATDDGRPNLATSLKWNKMAEAAGFQKGAKFRPSDLIGRSVRFTVSHRVDKNDPDKVYEEFKDFRPL